MRVATIEELANGYVLRFRCGEEQVAHAFAGDHALAKVLERLQAILSSPDESDQGAPSFGMLVALKGETEALERRTNKHRTPLPTEATVPLSQAHVPTVIVPRDQRPTITITEDDFFGV